MSATSATPGALRPPRLWAALACAVLMACGPVDPVPEDATTESSQSQALCYCDAIPYAQQQPDSMLPLCPYSQCQLCGDGYCSVNETQWNCPTDCGPAAWCGNGTCESGENETNCATDCYCGDGWCNGETIYTCPVDCGCPNPCGNGVCGAGESTATCPGDCGSACGDGACNGTETVYSCNADCGYCGDGYCRAPETRFNCATDCDIYSCLREQCPLVPEAPLSER
jgi:hypothetical protein